MSDFNFEPAMGHMRELGRKLGEQYAKAEQEMLLNLFGGADTPKHTPLPWKIVRSLTCGHLRAEHNFNSDPKKEWTDEDIAFMQRACNAYYKMFTACREASQELEKFIEDLEKRGERCDAGFIYEIAKQLHNATIGE